MQPAAQGERVYLRLLEEADVDERYLAWHRDPELMAFYSGSLRKFRREDLCSEIASGQRPEGTHVYGIFLLETQRIIGSIKLGPIQPRHRTADLAVLIGDREQHGKGLATEAIRLAARLAFERHGVRKLATGMYAQNVASIRAYLRAGFSVEGRRRAHYWVDGAPCDRVLVACFNPTYPIPGGPDS